MKDFLERKKAIEKDTRFKDSAKRAELVKLYKQHIKDLELEAEEREQQGKELFDKYNATKKQQFDKALPGIKGVKFDDILDRDSKVVAGLLSNVAALMLEQRTASRLMGRLSMVDDQTSFIKAVSDSVHGNPSATIQAWPQVMQVAQKYKDEGAGFNATMSRLFNFAIDGEKTVEEKKWEEKQNAKINEIESAIAKHAAQGVTKGLAIDNIKSEMCNIQADAMFAGDTEDLTISQKAEIAYFGRVD